MGQAIDKLTLRGFKSIRELNEFPLGNLNVLIGANGAGKSNFVSFFWLLRAMIEERLALAINKAGGADVQLFMGPKVTEKIEADLTFGHNGYEFALVPTSDNRLVFAEERIKYDGAYSLAVDRSIGRGHSESKLKEQLEVGNRNRNISEYIYESVSSWTVYHFHDTSNSAAMRRDQSLRDWNQFRHDASNIAAFLHQMLDTHEGNYELIRDTVRLIVPFFDDFLLRPETKGGSEQIRLEWRQKGSDFPFQPSQLSDGTIRFICLATALQQPSPPATIVIDEPELGLHPYAISILAGLIQSAAARTQVIVSTQSPTLLDYFEPEDIIVVNRSEAVSTFERLDEAQLTEWLKEYSVGELWQKNVVRGGPVHE